MTNRTIWRPRTSSAITRRPDDPAGHTVVSQLPQSDQGLAMPTFNEELLSLAKETLRLQQTEDETDE